jgi:uncharacterized damage-inducible protein DinB
VELVDVPVRDVRPLLAEERADFLALLASLDDADWAMPTEAGRWTVKDVTLHLLDDELGWLSRGRDNDPSGLLDDTAGYRQFAAALDAKNQRWADGASGLSHRVLKDLLEWSGSKSTSTTGHSTCASRAGSCGLDPARCLCGLTWPGT